MKPQARGRALTIGHTNPKFTFMKFIEELIADTEFKLIAFFADLSSAPFTNTQTFLCFPCSSQIANQRSRERCGEQITNVANAPTFYRQ